MAKTDFKTVEDYLATLSADDRTAVRAICDTIQKAVPDAEETISYQLPAYKYHGWIFYVSTATKHYAISCPPPFTVYEAFKAQLAPYQASKTTIQFPKSAPVPLKLIGDMSAYRAEENLKREASKKQKK
jgi:uncharacterized protein YdhG (YjbR/CyaY superfamily)